jgi:hypothetical protein
VLLRDGKARRSEKSRGGEEWKSEYLHKPFLISIGVIYRYRPVAFL